MIKFIFVILIIVLISTTSTDAKGPTLEGLEIGSPAWIVNMFFVQESFPDKSTYIGGEFKVHHAKGPTWGESVRDGMTISYRTLQESLTTTIYSVASSDSANHVDLYVWLSKDSENWKLTAIRSLAQTGIIYGAIEELEKRDSLTIKDQFTLENYKLIISSDDELKKYLKVHLETFEKIVAIHHANPELNTVMQIGYSGVESWETPPVMEIIPLLTKLRLDCSISYKDGSVSFQVGGILDNTVSILFIPKGKAPPEMSPGHYIYVEQIIPNWYIVKTT